MEGKNGDVEVKLVIAFVVVLILLGTGLLFLVHGGLTGASTLGLGLDLHERNQTILENQSAQRNQTGQAMPLVAEEPATEIIAVLASETVLGQEPSTSLISMPSHETIVTSDNTLGIQATGNATQCGDVNATITLTTSLSATGTCFNITASNIILNCANYLINYSTAGRGGNAINSTGPYRNVTVQNCNIQEGNISATEEKSAFHIVNASSFIIDNNTIVTIGNSSKGVYLINNYAAIVSNNQIYTSGTSAGGIVLEDSNNTAVRFNNISISGQTAYGIYIYGASNSSLLLNNNISSDNDFEIYDETPDALINFVVYNNSFGEMRWLDNGTGSFVRNVSVNGSLSLGKSIIISFNVIALNSSAFSPKKINSSINLSLFGLSFNTVQTVTMTSYFSPSSSDVRTNGAGCNATICPMTRYLNTSGNLYFNSTGFSSFAANGTVGCNNNVTRDFYLDRNVHGDDLAVCFTITISNITFDCQGYSITGARTGNGISFSAATIVDVKVRNCQIYNLTGNGIYAAYRWDIRNNNLFNVTTGISTFGDASNVGSPVMINNTISNSSTGIVLSTGVGRRGTIANNSLKNNVIGINSQGMGDLYQQNNFSNNKIAFIIDSNGGIFENNYFFNNTIGYSFLGYNTFENILTASRNNTFYGDRFVSNGNATYTNATTTDIVELFTMTNANFVNNTMDMIVLSFQTFNFTLINTTMNKNKMDIAANAFVYFKTIVDINVTDSSKNAVANANVNVFDSTGKLDNYNDTNDQGISRVLVTEMYRQNNLNFYVTPTTFRVNKNNYTYNSTIVNLLNQTYIAVNLTITQVNCGSTLTSNLDLGNGFTCSQNGFIINAPDVRVNGNGFTITGSGNNAGVIMNSKGSMANVVITGFAQGVYINNTNSSNISQVTIRGNTYGIVFNNSHNNSVYDSTIANNTFYQVLSTSTTSTNNSIINGSMDFNNMSFSGNSMILQKWYVRANASANGWTPLQGATMTAYFNSTGDLDDQATTESNGITTLKVTEAKISSSGRTIMTPHTINLSYDYLGTAVVNSTFLNISITNNTLVNLSIILNCVIPGGMMNITNTTTFCPGVFDINLITINTSGVRLTCTKTTLQNGNAVGAYTRIIKLQSVSNVMITGCIIDRGYSGIELDSTVNATIQNIIIKNSYMNGITTTNTTLTIFQNVTFSNNFNGMTWWNSINTTLLLSTFTGNRYYSLYIGSGASNNIIKNNTFTLSPTGITLLIPSIGDYPQNNSIYYNNFSSISSHYIELSTSSGLLNFFNTTVGNLTQGNEYDNYCEKGKDNNGDGYADAASTATAADWPFNSTVAAGKITEAGETVVDYGPRIISCPVATDIFLGSGGSQSSGGSSAAATATTATPTPTPVAAPAASASSSTSAGGAAAQPEYAEAEEAQQFLKTEPIKTKRTSEQTLQLSVTLENTGMKTMQLFPELSQDVGDSFFIVKTKTLGTEGSLFDTISSISYSKNAIAGRLLQATIVNTDQIIIPPGEKLEKVLEIKEGLVVPHQIRIQFKTLGKVVKEQEINIERKVISGTAVDVDTTNNVLDVYAIIVPEKFFKQSKSVQQPKSSSPTGLAIDSNPYIPARDEYLLELNFNKKEVPAVTLLNSLPSRFAIGQHIGQAWSQPTTSFSDLYGPYTLKKKQSFIFGQQYKYNPQQYHGDYEINTVIYQGSEPLVKNSFEVKLG